MENVMDRMIRIRDIAVYKDTSEESQNYLKECVLDQRKAPVTHATISDISIAALAYLKGEKDLLDKDNDAQNYYYKVYELWLDSEDTSKEEQ